jgi:hypothetical protein
MAYSVNAKALIAKAVGYLPLDLGTDLGRLKYVLLLRVMQSNGGSEQ